jgi:hypothetical protein
LSCDKAFETFNNYQPKSPSKTESELALSLANLNSFPMPCLLPNMAPLLPPEKHNAIKKAHKDSIHAIENLSQDTSLHESLNHCQKL